MKLLLLAMLLELAGQTTTNIGTIEGSVTLYGSAIPIPNSQIFVSPQGGGARGLQTTTDASGRFSFKEVPPGRYVVYADAEGYARPYKGGDSKSVNVTDNEQTQTIELTLVRMGTVKGRVYGRDGNPVSDIGIRGNPTVHVRDEVWVPGGSAPPFYGSTNANGEYEVRNVEPGEYYITAAPRESRSGLEVTYYPAAAVPSDAKPVTVRSGIEVIANIQLQTVSRFKVSGSIERELPAGGTERLTGLYLINRDTRVRDDVPSDVTSRSGVSNGDLSEILTNMPTVFLNESGFEISAVRPGSYDLFATVTSNSTEPQRLNTYIGRVSVEVVDRNIDNAAIVLRPGVSVTGNYGFGLMPRGTLASIPGISNALIESYGVGTIGKTVVNNVPPGIYTITDTELAGQAAISDVHQNGRSIFDSGLTVGTTPPDPLAIVFSQSTGTVRGVVQASDRNQAAYAWVTVAPLSNQKQNPTRYRMVRADAEGRFNIPNVASGEYKVFVFDEIAYGAALNPNFISRYESSGLTVTIKARETITVDPQVIPVP